MDMKIELNIIITNEDIDDIVCTAIEGGINYWCGEIEVVGELLGEYTSDQISRGGELILHVIENPNENWILNKEKLLYGIEKYITEYMTYGTWDNILDGNKIDVSYVDALIADVIIQHALFDEIVFG